MAICLAKIDGYLLGCAKVETLFVGPSLCNSYGPTKPPLHHTTTWDWCTMHKCVSKLIGFDFIIQFNPWAANQVVNAVSRKWWEPWNRAFGDNSRGGLGGFRVEILKDPPWNTSGEKGEKFNRRFIFMWASPLLETSCCTRDEWSYQNIPLSFLSYINIMKHLSVIMSGRLKHTLEWRRSSIGSGMQGHHKLCP